MIGQVLKQWLWDSYDHLGRLIAINVLLALLLGGALLYIGIIIAAFVSAATPLLAVATLLGAIVVIGPIWMALWVAPLAHFARLVSAEKDPNFAEFRRGLFRLFLPAWRYFLVMFAAIAVLLFNAWFYVFSGRLPDAMRIPGYLAAGLCFWAAVLVAITLLPALPLLAEPQPAIRRVFRISLAILIKYPGTVLGAVFVLILLSLIGGLLLRMAGFLVFGFSGTALLANSLYDVILSFETRRDEAAADNKSSKPRTWKDLQVHESSSEKERMDSVRYNRTIKDLLKPWEM